MAVRTPYYNLHQIVTGQYTGGNEYVLNDGTDYIGEYHILPTEQRFTESRPTEKSRELFVKRFEVTNDTLTYNRVKGLETANYNIPILFYPSPTLDEYEEGHIFRYFVQKRNSPENSIIEIDVNQYTTLNNKNRPGLNSNVWNVTILKWRISKLPVEDAKYLNWFEIVQHEHKFPGLGKYLTQHLELWR